MKVEQIYTGCLAEAAYYIESNGEVAIIDPLRDIKPYLNKIEKENTKIKYVFETHFHADFVSGHVDLSKKTGAEIVYGPSATAEFDFIEAKDGQEFKIGDARIKVLHTPGHTFESSTYLLIDEEGKEHAIFTGDTLFLGDVGRPDLAIKSDWTEKDLAGMLFDSLRNKIMPLPDDIIVYPGHGAGSSCGKNMSTETIGTLGDQKVNNYALRSDMTKSEFIDELLEGILPPPQYFPKNAMLNKKDISSIDNIIETGSRSLNSKAFEIVANETEALIIDTRSKEEFVNGFIPNSIFIGIDGNFASWVGTLITDMSQPILFVSEPGREEEIITRLARVGYDNIVGYLKGGFKLWDGEKDTIQSVSPHIFADTFHKNKINVVDVRKTSEFESEHIIDAFNAQLNYINDYLADIDKQKEHYIHCQSGYRSVIFISILKARGYEKLINIEGGFVGVSETDVPKTDFVCPTTLK